MTPKGDPAKKTFRIYLDLPDDTPLRVGMSVEANVISSVKASALTVPSEALSGNAVFVIENGRAVRREVKTGIRGTRAVEILDGVAEGQRVIAPVPKALRHGDHVRVIEKTPHELIVYIALTHIRFRLRQTLVGMLGIATGVGFSIMMASLMEGSQRDFVATLVDTLAHISVRDEQRNATTQPAENAFDAAQIDGLRPDENRPGLKNPLALIAALESWVPGAVAPRSRPAPSSAMRGAILPPACSASTRGANPACPRWRRT